MQPSEMIQLKRECDVTQIPSGFQLKLPAGTKVRITQYLGGTYTVMTELGYLARIDGSDADALGKEIAQEKTGESTQAAGIKPTEESVEKSVWNQLKTCYDPEIPVNIVELGLIYDCKVISLEEDNFKVEVKMTLTAPGCGMGSAIAGDAQNKILKIPGVKEARVELVWMPPWSPDKMSEAAKLQLGLM